MKIWSISRMWMLFKEEGSLLYRGVVGDMTKLAVEAVIIILHS